MLYKRNTNAKILRFNGITPEELLIKGGYTKKGADNYIRYFEPNYRYHAYIKSPIFSKMNGVIEIHTDLTIKSDCRTKHLSSTFNCKPECNRLAKLAPGYIPPVSIVRKERTPEEKEERKKLKQLKRDILNNK